MTKTMNIRERVENVLKRNTKVPGITPRKLATLAKTTVDNAYRCVYDLRNKRAKSNLNIATNTQVKNGKAVTYYRSV